MNLKNRIIAIAICVLATSLCLAQGGGGRQGRRGGFGAPYMATRLINNPEVQTELALTDDEKTKITDLRQSFRGAGGGGQPTPEEREQRMLDQQKQIEGVLTADQVKRLHEIQVQVAGDLAVLIPFVQDGIGLTDDEKTQVKKVNSDYNAANASIFQKMRDGSLDRQAAFDEIRKNGDTLKDNLKKAVPADKYAKVKDLGGKPFAAAADLATPRGPGGGRRNRNAGGGNGQ
ncbi:MAG TPA: hypothetical protein VG944_07350 [Fimbriimonas sp.]|nr:hypothetical protein [Fimbriimonas sp.]